MSIWLKCVQDFNEWYFNEILRFQEDINETIVRFQDFNQIPIILQGFDGISIKFQDFNEPVLRFQWDYQTVSKDFKLLII